MGLFGPGNKITLTLEKYEYAPGEAIKGNVTFKLKKPMMARKLEVALIGTKIEKFRTTRTYGTGSHRHSRPAVDESQVIIYNQTVSLDEEKEYSEGTYPFEINIPLDILSEASGPKGRFGALVETIKEASVISSTVEWSVDVNLDVPWKSDVNTYRKITLTKKT